MLQKRILFFILMLSGAEAFASHMIGGELNYLYIGNNQYIITLKLFRDCNSSTPYDPQSYVAVFDIYGDRLDSPKIVMQFPGATLVPPDLTDPCLIPPANVCVQEAVYRDTVTLPPYPGGYILAYERCCRTSSLVNIFDPSGVGATYTCVIPDTTNVGYNSNPYFKNYPPIDICVDAGLSVDESAIDPDGDSLAYSLCTPLTASSFVNPETPYPPPYDSIIWLNPYNVHNQIGGNPVLSIDSKTGLLTGFPTAIGQYVVGLCVKEYRKGILLSTHSRDFQFNVAACDSSTIAKLSAENATTNTNSDTLLVCGSHAIQFVNESISNSLEYLWDFGDPGTTMDTSSLKNPVYVYPDTGFYKVMLIASPHYECADTAYRYLNVRDSIFSNFQFANVCLDDSTHFTNLSRSENGALVSYEWNFGDQDSSAVFSPSHLYSFPKNYFVELKVKDIAGCAAQSSYDVTVHALPYPAAGPDTSVCKVDPVQLHASNGASYHWSPDFEISDTTSSRPIVTPGKTFVYHVLVIDSNGCRSFDSVKIIIGDSLPMTAFGDTSVCPGNSAQLLATNANQYTWSPSTGLSNPFAADPVATPATSTTYIVSGTVGSCTSIDSVKVNVLPFPQIIILPDTTIDIGQSIQLFVSGGTTYSWYPGTGLSDTTISSPIASPLATITYFVKVGNQIGCSKVDSVQIKVNDNETVSIPTAFTPNGDGINDRFSFHMQGIAEVISVDVFDRWGKSVFHTSDENNFWDGTLKGQPLPIGSYAYQIVVQTLEGRKEVFYGSVVLIR